MHAWIKESAPWYQVHLPEEHFNGSRYKRMGWTYLQKCVDSPSMMNRKRIAEQLERKADEMGI